MPAEKRQPKGFFRMIQGRSEIDEEFKEESIIECNNSNLGVNQRAGTEEYFEFQENSQTYSRSVSDLNNRTHTYDAYEPSYSASANVNRVRSESSFHPAHSNPDRNSYQVPLAQRENSN